MSAPKRSARRAAASAKPIVRQAAKYAVPAASVLGTGALATVGILMRDQIAELAQSAIEEGVSLAKNVSVSKVLRSVGLQRRPSIFAMALPALGALTVGAIGGAALAYFFAPRIAELGKKVEETATRALEGEENGSTASPLHVNSFRDSIASEHGHS